MDIEVYTLAEAADVLRVSPETLRLRLASGEIEGHRTSERGRWRITREALERYINKSKENA